GATRRGNAELYAQRHCEEQSDEAIQSLTRGPGLLCFACNDGVCCLKFESKHRQNRRSGVRRDDGRFIRRNSPHLRFAFPGNGSATPVLISFKIMLVRTWRMPGRRNMKVSRKSL